MGQDGEAEYAELIRYLLHYVGPFQEAPLAFWHIVGLAQPPAIDAYQPQPHQFS